MTDADGRSRCQLTTAGGIQRRPAWSPDGTAIAYCLYGRTAGTPPEALTPLDLVRDALGLKAAQQVLDEDGLTGDRKAARPTTWAELSVTIEALRYVFGRRLEVQDGDYARHLCDDVVPFVEGMDQRLQEYADFARMVDTRCTTSRPGAAGAKLRNDLTPVAKMLGELGQRQRGLKSPRELLPLCAKIRQLTAKESSDNLKQFEECCQAILGVVRPREETRKHYRKLAIELRDTAGTAVLTDPELAGLAQRIRALCQGILRSRFYTEGDWRGEDYRVPSFWFGPRPYE
jgi:hypothetical protein